MHYWSILNTKEACSPSLSGAVKTFSQPQPLRRNNTSREFHVIIPQNGPYSLPYTISGLIFPRLNSWIKCSATNSCKTCSPLPHKLMQPMTNNYNCCHFHERHFEEWRRNWGITDHKLPSVWCRTPYLCRCNSLQVIHSLRQSLCIQTSNDTSQESIACPSGVHLIWYIRRRHWNNLTCVHGAMIKKQNY